MEVQADPAPDARGAEITLFIPGLFTAPLAPTPLARLLARADRFPGGLSGSTERHFALFGISPDPAGDLPVAAVTRVADMGVVDREWWIRADPVYLEPRRDRLVLHAGLGLNPEESDLLASELNESLVLDGWLLKAPHPERWYLKPAREPGIATTSLAQAAGHDIQPLLPRGPDHKAWHARLNELQILLHTSQVNASRETRGELPANSVWFWGGGRLPRLGTTGNWSRVWASDPLSLGLARLSELPALPLPAGGAEITARPAPGRSLLVLDSLAAAPGPGDENEWSSAMTMLAGDWLAPLVDAVHRGNLDALTLISDTGPAFRYVRAHRWRFWRRARPLAAWGASAA